MRYSWIVSALALWCAPALASIEKVTDHGASTSATGAVNTAAFVAAFAAAGSGGTVVLPCSSAGAYTIDNSVTATLTITGFTGTFDFQCGSSLLFSNNAKGGFTFTSADGANFRHYKTRYSVIPPDRIGSEDALTIVGSSRVSLYDTDIVGAPATGVYANGVVRMVSVLSNIQSTQADCFLHQNNQDARQDSHTGVDCDDDLSSWGVYESDEDAFGRWRTGGYETNFVGTGGDAEGWKSFGQSGFTLDGCTITGPFGAGPGIIVQTDGAVTSETPTNVLVKNCTITGAGDSGDGAVTISNVGSLVFDNVDVTTSGGRCYNAGTGAVSLTINNSTLDGCTVGMNLIGTKLSMSNNDISNASDAGLYASMSGAVTIDDTDLLNTGSSGLHRQMWINAAAPLTLTNTDIQDNRNPAVGYILKMDAGVTSGSVNCVTNTIPNGTYSVSNDGSASYTEGC